MCSALLLGYLRGGADSPRGNVAMVRVDVSAVPLGLLRALDLQLGALLGPGLGIARGGGRAAVSQRVARRQLRGKYKYVVVDVKLVPTLSSQ